MVCALEAAQLRLQPNGRDPMATKTHRFPWMLKHDRFFQSLEPWSLHVDRQDLEAILYVMRLDVGSLVERLETAHSRGDRQGLVPGGGPKQTAYDPEVLVRVLSHRCTLPPPCRNPLAARSIKGTPMHQPIWDACVGGLREFLRSFISPWLLTCCTATRGAQASSGYCSASVCVFTNTPSQMCRAEHAASKYLKTEYRLPKKLEESSFSRNLEVLKGKLSSANKKQVPGYGKPL